MFSSQVANGSQKSSSQGSESTSSASSLSSGTPVSSLSGLSQVMFPPSLAFGSDMVDVCISTEDQRSVGLSHRWRIQNRTSDTDVEILYVVVISMQVRVGANGDRDPDGPAVSADWCRHHAQPGTDHSAQGLCDPSRGGRQEKGVPKDGCAAGAESAEPTNQQVSEPGHHSR